MTNLQLHLQKAKRLGVNLTVLATSISLAACGGGGGYYGEVAAGSSSGNDNTNTGGETQSKEVSGVTLALSKNELNVKGDTITLTAKAVDENGGGIAGTAINLNIKDAIKNGATADSSQVITDEKGNATFTVTLSGSNPNLTELLFTATVANTTISDVKKVAVTGAGTVTQSQYELSFEAITPLMVSGGETIVRIRAIDANGGGVPNENIVLKVKEFQKNGVNIKGLSTALTDNQGYADFTLELPTGKEADRAALLNEGIELEAVLTEASGATKTQVYTVGVSSVVNVVSDLALTTTNNNKVDAIDGTINVIVIAKNPEGTVVAGKEVQLSLDEQAIKYGAKLVSSLVKTNSKGEAVFSIKTEANSDNPDGKLLVSNGITVRALLKENTAITTQTTKITVVSPVVDDVASLSMATANEVNIAGGDSVITVTAKDKNGGALANKVINLNIPQTAGLSIKNGSKIITDSNGQAKFTVSFNPSNVPSSVLNDLLNSGIIITAQYKNLNNQTVSQTTKVGFYEVKVEKEVQRIVLTASKGIVSSTGDTVQVTARALDNEGNPAVNKAISLGLTQEAQQNGVSFDGKVTRNTDKDGYVSFTIHTNALNEQAVEKLVQSGIAVAVSTKLADGSIVTQNITVMVAPSALSTAEVAYLGITDQPSLNIAGKIINTIVVQAYKSNGSLAANKDLTLSLDKKYSGISIDNTAPTTNASGQATFNLRYDPSQLSAVEKAELLQQGLNITAKFGTVTQKTKVSFYSFDINIQRMDLVVDKPALVAKVGVAQKVVATVTLKDSVAAAIKDRQVTLALDPAALQQGVSIVGATGGSTAVTTAANGQATVELSVSAKDQAMLDALVASGIGIGASAVQGDGSSTISQSTKINVLSEAAENEVGYLTTDSGSVIATTGGSSTITVKAFNSKGIAAAGKTVKLNLGAIPAGLNIKADASSKVTDASGNAAFNVTYTAATNLTADQIKALLAGISATASYTNAAGKTITQSTTVQFYVNQQNIQRMDLVVDKPALVATIGTAEVVTTVVTLRDEQGQPIVNRQVALALNDSAFQAGVRFAQNLGGTALVYTNSKGQASIKLNVNTANAASFDNLVANGITISAAAVQGDGGTISQSTKINVLSEAAENEVGYLTTDSGSVIATTGGSSTITVKAFNSKGIAAAGKTVKLNLGAIPAGLNIKADASSKVTDASGNAAFNVTYTAATNLTADQIKALLAGISATASYTNAAGKTITQSTTVQFYVNQQNIQRMDLVVDKPALVAKVGVAQKVVATVTLKDSAGAVIKDRQVTLALDPAALQNGVNLTGRNGVAEPINGGLTVVQTNDKGQATVSLSINPASQVALNALMVSGIGIGASAVQGDGTGEITQNTKVDIVSEEATYLTMSSNASIATTGGESIVTVKAMSAKGIAAANQKVRLSLDLTGLPSDIDLKINGTNAQQGAEVSTDDKGVAQFTILYRAKSNLSAEQVQKLLAGIQAKASYSAPSTNEKATQSTVVQFYVNQQNIQRMDLVTAMSQSPTQNGGALSLRLNDKQSFKTTVTLKDRDGKPVANRQVILSLDNIAVDNNILFRVVNFKDVTGGLTVVTTNANGQAEVTVEALVQNQADLDALVDSGININASAVQGDGSTAINQTTNVRVVSKAAEEVAATAVSYLTAVSSQSLATTVNGSTEIKVKAFNAKGEVLASKGISLELSDIPAGLTVTASPSSGNSDITDANGEAKFTVTYTAPADANLTPIQIKALLAGVKATASYTEGGKVITQSTKIQFYANSAAIATDAQGLELSTSKGEVIANSDSFTLSTKVIDRSGNPAANRFVSLNLDAAAAQNGVTIAGMYQQKTDASGNVTFTINVRGASQQMIDNLVANGISLTASVVQSNGAEIKQTTQVMAKAPQALAVKSLTATPSAESIDSTGGSTVIAVRAVDISGNPVVNQNISFALGGMNATNARVSVDRTSATTNSQGYVYFTVNIANGELDSDLIKDGLTYAVNTINQNDGNSVNQVGKINVRAPAGTYNLLPLTSSKPALLITGDTVTVSSKLVNNKGEPLKSQPVTLVVNNTLTNGGVNVEGGMTAVTDSNGNVSFKVTLPAKTNQAQIDELLANGLTLRAAVTLPNGNQRYSLDLKLNVNAAVNPNHLKINSSNEHLSVNGDKAIITVSLLDNLTNQAVKDQQVTLRVKKTSSTTGTNIGIVNEAEGNGGITDTYTVTTDQNGNGFFTLLIPESGLDKDALFASGIELEASQTDANGIIVKQIRRLGIDRPGSTAPRYSLRIASNKPSLNVRNDSAEVTVTLLDQNGGRVADRYVTLNVADFIRNGASIVGASGKNTDANGEAIFTIKIDETARNQNYSATAFDADNLVLRATSYIASTQDPVTLQDFMIDVVQANVPNPIGNLTFGKSALLEKSNDGNYYTEAVSAQLVDRDGKPIANQSVTMSIDLLGIGKGFYTPAKDVNGDPTRIKTTTVSCFGGLLPAGAQIATAFVSPQGSANNIVTYTTDGTGKFDFRIRYLRQYAGWQTVNLTARVTINGQSAQNLQSSLNYSLNMVKDDFGSEPVQPFDASPLGLGSTCQ